MADMKWKWASKSEIYKNIVRRVDGVGKSNHAWAVKRAAESQARLAPHNANNAKRRAEEGKHMSYVTSTRGALGVDAFVNLHDPDGAAAIIESKLGILGSYTRFSGEEKG